MNRVAVAAGVLAVALGAAGLVRAAVPQSAQASGTAGPGRISVVGAYVVAPVPPTQLAAGYFTVYNTTSEPDRLTSVQTGAGATATLHTVDAHGDMTAESSDGVTIPAHGSFRLAVGRSHLMIGELFGPVRAGQTVDITLQFARAGTVAVTAPVVAVGSAPPAAARSAASEQPNGQSSMSDMSGDH